MRKIHKETIMLVTLSCLATIPGVSQGNFVNLNFESATLAVLPPGQSEVVPISAALPGWNAFVGQSQITSVLHNELSLGGTVLSVFGPQFDPSFIIEGNYTVGLLAGANPLEPISISQTGLVPLGMASLLFKARPNAFVPANDPYFQIALGGQPLMLYVISTGPLFDTYGVDVSSFAGQENELRFTVSRLPNGANFVTFDSIAFSTQPVPEPSTLALFGLGGVVLAFAQWRFHRRK